MILDFDFSLNTRLIFGKTAVEKLSLFLNEGSYKNILFIYGQGSIENNGVYDSVVKQITDAGVAYYELPGCRPNPTNEFVNKVKLKFKDKNIDMVLAVGGGSVIDASKAIGLLLNNEPDEIWDYKENSRLFTQPSLPVGVVLTTAGTGSEVNGGFVINNAETREKYGFVNFSTKPVFALCNPEYTFSLNRINTNNNTIDIISHLLEQYFSSNLPNNYLIDNLILSTAGNVLENQKIVMQDIENYEARANLMLASTISLSYLYSMGKNIVWSLHNIEHVISGMYDIAHGTGLAALLPSWIDYMSSKDENKKRIEALYYDVFFEYQNDSQSLSIAIENWLKECGMPTSLSEIIKNKDDIEKITKKVLENTQFITKSKFTDKDIKCILENSWH